MEMISVTCDFDTMGTFSSRGIAESRDRARIVKRNTSREDTQALGAPRARIV